MAEYTTNLNLEKPTGGENICRQTLNDNADKIDQKFGIGAGEGHSHSGVAGQGTKISFNDLNDKPSAMAPSAHKSSHATGGADVLTPTDIGAETPAGAQAKVDAVQGNLTAHLNDIANNKLLFKVGTNLLTTTLKSAPNIISDSYINSSGVLQVIGDYTVSGFIPITANGLYIISVIKSTQSAFGGWYDASHTWISQIIGQFTQAPSNAAYARININDVAWEAVQYYAFSGFEKFSFKDKKVAFLGDSITSGSGTFTGVKYHDVIKSQLGLSEALNYGVSGSLIAKIGSKSDSFVERYSAMDSTADAVIVFGGINDFRSATPAIIGVMNDRVNTTFYGALHVMLSGLVLKYFRKPIFFVTPVHSIGETTPNATTNKTLTEHGEIIKEVCRYYGVPVIDLFKDCMMQPNDTNSKLQWFNTDGIHPNPYGHLEIGTRISNYLKNW